MQLELNERTEEVLSAEANTLGLSAAELSVRVLAGHAAEWELRHTVGAESRRAQQIDEAIQWILTCNPNIETMDPYATDWQALKAEGRP